MTPYIPFVMGENDLNNIDKYFKKTTIVRIAYQSRKHILKAKRKKLRIWYDGSFDFFGNTWKVDKGTLKDKWYENLHDDFKPLTSKFEEFYSILQSKYFDNIKKRIIDSTIVEYYNLTFQKNIDYYTIPQLPYDSKQNRITVNKIIIDCFNKLNCKQKLILPIIISDHKLLKTPKERNKLISFIDSCINKYSIYGIWIVDDTINELKVTGTMGNKIEDLIKFHETVRDITEENDIKLFAGPYWAINIILWSKKLVDSPVIGLGKGFHYIKSGMRASPPSTRIVIPDLHQLVKTSIELKNWFIYANNKTNDKKIKENLKELIDNYDTIDTRDGSRQQILSFYSNWLETLLSIPPSGRAIALYQLFSSSYIFGKSIGKDLPIKGVDRKPGSVAQQYMLNCL